MQRITPCLWFDNQAEEAANFYVSVFSAVRGAASGSKGSKVLSTKNYDEAGAKAAHRPVGSVMIVTFELDGQKFMALNGGPIFKFSPAISLIVNCETQEEIDQFWAKLSEGGKPVECGWLTDKFGLSWQVVPTILGKLLQDKDARKSARVMSAVLQMKKLDIQGLKQAYKQP